MSFWPFTKKPEPPKAPARLTTVGQPVHLNLDPASNKSMLRSLSRMIRLIEYQTKTHLAAEQLATGQEEFDRRRQMLLANGINVPSDEVGIKALIAELYAKEPQA